MQQPNIVFVMSDDHAAHAIGSYGSAINTTPAIDRLAREGAVLENAFCANSLCAPSRASILTGTYNHVNGVRTLSEEFDSHQTTFCSLLESAGYRNAIFGKWHLGHGAGHDPVGFDEWRVLDGQGEYLDPTLIGPGGPERHSGHVTDVVTDLALQWLERQDDSQPFCLLVHHKAPHRPFVPAERHQDLFRDPIPEPSTFRDDYAHRAAAAAAARMRIDRDLRERDLKEAPPSDLTAAERASWAYQRFIADYLRCVAGVDESVGRILDALERNGLSENTLVIYTSDQGFFLGDHGWYDKRFMYEESLRMPVLMRLPHVIPAGLRIPGLVSNVDFAPTILDLAGVPVPAAMQGHSIAGALEGTGKPSRQTVYYRYWEHDDPAHGVWAHYGIRTERYKLIYYYADGMGLAGTSQARYRPQWELFDLERDPHELHSRYDDPAYADIQASLLTELEAVMQDAGDTPYPEQVR